MYLWQLMSLNSPRVRLRLLLPACACTVFRLLLLSSFRLVSRLLDGRAILCLVTRPFLAATQSRRKIEEKSMQKSIEKTMHLGIDFWKDFGGFLEAKWRHVGTKIDQKSMPTWKSDFLKKPCFSLRKTMILRVEGVEVGSKNR